MQHLSPGIKGKFKRIGRHHNIENESEIRAERKQLEVQRRV